MWELALSRPIYSEETYCQIDLIRMIALQGLRPFIPDDLPQFYRNLMVRCWDKNPLLRPNAEEILSQLWNWHINSNIQKEIDKYDQTTCNEEIKDNTQYNPELYTSKFIRTDVVTNKSFANVIYHYYIYYSRFSIIYFHFYFI
ncbi:hypothetical protein C2G38_203352 [Gigaspora rosea]|uniref:Serine-threonine/tyrosine-protein kinase catalytic domain-containing protein n=1 Tax=Gigaspora rosea TaxID=44941 RepID=A0A397UJ33_9GLOM|nr:hypothetical protein C2G38_203352 [Gigaspora rosea]